MKRKEIKSNDQTYKEFFHKGKCLLCKKSVNVYAKILGRLYESVYQCDCGLCATQSCMLKDKKKVKK